jgi:hypothetical protein
VRRRTRLLLIGLGVLAVAGGGTAAAVVVAGKHDEPVHASRAEARATTGDTDTETATTDSAPTDTATEPAPPAETATSAQQPAAPAAPAENDPDLQRLLEQVRSTKGFQDGADLATFALLYDHLKTGHEIPVSVAMATLDRVRGDVAYRHRLAGYLAFWQQNYGGVDWQRFPMDEARMLGMYDAYTYQQLAARQNRINQAVGAMVASEEAWRQTMTQIRARDEQIASQQYVSDVQYEAERAIQRAQSALAR